VAPSPPAAPDELPTGRLFGVLPNESTIEAGYNAPPITTKQAFAFAAQSTFDKAVYPFVGVVAYLGVGQSAPSYWSRYAMAFTDNAVGNYMTTAVMPMLFNQDPRYFQLGSGSIVKRLAYAASRAVVTRSRTGSLTFNISELGGNTAAAWLSNVYYPAADRTASATLARAGSQVMWDTISFECKEFWPDIRRALQQTFHHQ